MPQRIEFTLTSSNKLGVIEFVYDATGAKLRKIVSQSCLNPAALCEGNASNTYDYVNGVEYKNGALERVAHAEGSLSKNAHTGAFEMEYVLRDHLGNTRVTFSDSDNDGHVTAADIKQINHYYPFGLNMEGNWNGAQGNNKYQYNAKEWNDDFGLGWNDYGARFYDPAISRWWSQDKMIEAYPAQSSYAFCFNNPFRYIDVDGNFIIDEKTAKEYPEFAQLMADFARIYEDKPKEFKAALQKYGEMSDKQILEWLTPGKGPKISGAFLKGDAYGLTTNNKKRELRIFISKRVLDLYKNSINFTKPCKLAVYTLLEATVFHELTHYGDHMSDGLLTQSSPLGTLDGGIQFEIAAYGKIIQETNPEFKDCLSNAPPSHNNNNNNNNNNNKNNKNEEKKGKKKDKPRA